jgi:hypothetical protein
MCSRAWPIVTSLVGQLLGIHLIEFGLPNIFATKNESVSGDLTVIPRAIELSRQALRLIRSNLISAASYNAIGIGLAASGHLPASARVAGSIRVRHSVVH